MRWDTAHQSDFRVLQYVIAKSGKTPHFSIQLVEKSLHVRMAFSADSARRRRVEGIQKRL